jgi:hypothetical protein
MRVRKTAIAVLFMLGCLIFSAQAQGVVITPSNVVLPTSAGEIFSFDFVVFDANSTSAFAFQTTISVSGPGLLSFDELNSEAVAKEAMYWFENSTSATAVDLGGNSYSFGDNTTPAELLGSNDIMASYAFIWNGTEGDYTFTLNLNTSKSFVQRDNLEIEALQFTPGIYYQGGNSYFIVNIPEPGTLIIFTLGSIAALLKRRGT